MHTTELAKILQRAASLVGGPEALAARLGAPPGLMQRWISARLAAPTHIFLGAVDIIAMHTESAIRGRRTSGDRPDQRVD
jgi:hypothetical protein